MEENMSFIKQYWLNKEQRAERAKTHVVKMKQQFSKNIEHSIASTKIYNDANVDTKDVSHKFLLSYSLIPPSEILFVKTFEKQAKIINGGIADTMYAA